MRNHDRFFREQIGRPENWQVSAENLMAAAMVLWPHIALMNEHPVAPVSSSTWDDLEKSIRLSRLVPPFKMLVRFAIENFLKGLYIAKKFGIKPEGEGLLGESKAPKIEDVADMIGVAYHAFMAGITLQWLQRTIKATTPSALPKEINTHDLVALATVAKCSLSRKERVLLSRLTEFSEYAGRYPAPRKVRAFVSGPLLGNREYERMRDFVLRLREEYSQLGFLPMHFEKGEQRDKEMLKAAEVQASWKRNRAW